MSREVAIHLNPAWRDRANFIAFVSIELDEPGERWEQLWARQIANNLFEICCIPFFAYDLALGDQVDTLGRLVGVVDQPGADSDLQIRCGGQHPGHSAGRCHWPGGHYFR